MAEQTRLLKIDEVARRLACNIKTLRRKIKLGEFPKGLQPMGRVQVWTEQDIEYHLYRTNNAHRFVVGGDFDDFDDEEDEDEVPARARK